MHFENYTCNINLNSVPTDFGLKNSGGTVAIASPPTLTVCLA